MANTWEQYLENITAGNEKGALFLIDGTKLAESDGLNITQEEVQKLVQIMKTSSYDIPVLGGVEYWTIYVSPDKLIATKRYNKQCGLSVQKTARLVIIGTYIERHQPGQSQSAVGKLADYFMENQF